MPMFVPHRLTLIPLLQLRTSLRPQPSLSYLSRTSPIHLRRKHTHSHTTSPLRSLSNSNTKTHNVGSGRKLEGSCQCGGVEFSLNSNTPVPYQLCACSICRKVGGSVGAINLGGIADSLDIKKGKDLIKKYTAIRDRGTPRESTCNSERNFCGNCSSMLWLWDSSWPELIHPFASAIDTDLPVPDEMVCLLGDSKPAWARWPEGKKKVFEGYPEDSLEDWHKKHGLFMK